MTDFNIDDFLPYKLSLVTNTISQSLAREYEAFNITRTQWRILAVLGGAGDMTAQGIANKTMMDKTTLSRAIKNLVERKLVKRQAQQNDGRVSSLCLTSSGRQLFKKIVPIANQADTNLRAKLSQNELAMLEKILHRLTVAK